MPERVARTVLTHGGALIDLEFDGSGSTPVVVKEQQRDPVRGALIHLDLLEVKLDEEIEAEVPIELLGTEDAPGRQGGRRAGARHAPDHDRGPADRDPREHPGRRLRDVDRRHASAQRADRPRGSRVRRRTTPTR